MLDLFPENEKSIWKLYISYPKDCKDYNTFLNRLNKFNESFSWEDVTSYENSIEKNIDNSNVLIVLSGLWKDNKDLIKNHIKIAQIFEKPIVVIRPYGEEEIPMELNEIANQVVGWNSACIVDAILSSINGDDYELRC